VVVVGVDMDSKATQTLKATLESTNAMLRANTKACNYLVKQGIHWFERCWLFMDWDCSGIDCIG
jgi:hypothetical protein